MKSNNLSNAIVACILFGVLGASAFAAGKVNGKLTVVQIEAKK